MRQSIGMNAQLNIIIVFILIVFALMAASLSYYKAYKVSNSIISSIEKYEGFNTLAQNEINNSLNTLGYNRVGSNCNESSLTSDGYCVNLETQSEGDEITGYRYRITTYMYLDLPVVEMIRVPVTKYTNTIQCFKDNCDGLE